MAKYRLKILLGKDTCGSGVLTILSPSDQDEHTPDRIAFDIERALNNAADLCELRFHIEAAE